MDSGSGSMLMVIVAVAFFAIIIGAVYFTMPEVINGFFSNLTNALTDAWKAK